MGEDKQGAEKGWRLYGRLGVALANGLIKEKI